MDILSTGTTVDTYLEITSSPTDVGLTSESATVIAVTGASNQDITLPDATTCFLGTTFTFTNNSTGIVSIYPAAAPDVVIEAGDEYIIGSDDTLVVTAVGASLGTIAPGATMQYRLTDTSSVAGVWVPLINTSAASDLQSVYDNSGPSHILDTTGGLLITGTSYPVIVNNTPGLNVLTSLLVQYGGPSTPLEVFSITTGFNALLLLDSDTNASAPHIEMRVSAGSIKLQTPSILNADYTLILPSDPPANGEALAYNGSQLIWVPSAAVPVAGDGVSVSGSTISVKRHASYTNSSGGAVLAGQVVFLRDNGAGVLEIMELADPSLVNAPDSVIGIVKDVSIANGAVGNVTVVHGFEEFTLTLFVGDAGKDVYLSASTSGELQTNFTGYSVGDHVISVGKITDDLGHIIFAPRYVMTY